MDDAWRYCPVCGGELVRAGRKYSCGYCGGTFTEKRLDDSLIGWWDTSGGEHPEESVRARRDLYDALHADDVDMGLCRAAAREIAALSPYDFLANAVAATDEDGENGLFGFLDDCSWDQTGIYAREALILAFETGAADAAEFLKEGIEDDLDGKSREREAFEREYAERALRFRYGRDLGKEARAGRADAQYLLGVFYFTGLFLEKDPREAVRLFSEAAEGGEPKAQYAVGTLLESGVYVEKDPEGAAEMYRRSADGGDADAAYRLANMRYRGEGVEKDRAEAVRLYREAAEGGVRDARCALGLCMLAGEGTEKDEKGGAEQLTLAAKKGSLDAAKALSALFLSDDTPLPGREEEGVKWLKKAAEGGDAGCGLELADRLSEGRGVERDLKGALRWYSKAEKGGCAEAARKAGDLYLSGDGTVRDSAKAVKKYRKAAGLGDAEAMERLVWCLERGEGAERNEREAAAWRERAERARAEDKR